MIGTREFPHITSEDLMGVNFTGCPAEIPITSLYGWPAGIFSRGLPYHVRIGIERAVCDLGYRWGVTAATVEMRHSPAGVSFMIKLEYRKEARPCIT